MAREGRALESHPILSPAERLMTRSVSEMLMTDRMPTHSSMAPVVERLIECYGVEGHAIRVIFAPYRICPLGAHIDHQLGRVTAMALDHGVLLAFAPTAEREVRVRSLDFEGEARVPLDGGVPAPQPDDWGNYPRGAVRAMKTTYPLRRGLVGVTAGRVAEGGLSSSAAVGVAYLLALQHVNQLSVDATENIRLVQRIENDYLGLRIGVLDQSAILLSRDSSLTLIDCADLTHQLIDPAASMPGYDVLIVFSGLRQALVGTGYNQRVAECEEAARMLLRAAGRARATPKLRHVTPEEYEQFGRRLAGPPARRAAHFFSEMERVQQGVQAWQDGDARKFGSLITQSGESSITSYECGAPPLIDLYHALIQAPGVWGARFSGAGFRGCCLALVEAGRAAAVAEEVRAAYAAKRPALADHAWSLRCRTGDGARLVDVS